MPSILRLLSGVIFLLLVTVSIAVPARADGEIELFLDPVEGKLGDKINVEGLGFKCHMNDITASIGLVQLESIDKANARRKEIADYYKEKVIAINPDYRAPRESSYHFYPMFFEERDKVYEALTKNDIYPGMHYKRNDLYEIYKNYPTNI